MRFLPCVEQIERSARYEREKLCGTIFLTLYNHKNASRGLSKWESTLPSLYYFPLRHSVLCTRAAGRREVLKLRQKVHFINSLFGINRKHISIIFPRRHSVLRTRAAGRREVLKLRQKVQYINSLFGVNRKHISIISRPRHSALCTRAAGRRGKMKL